MKKIINTFALFLVSLFFVNSVFALTGNILATSVSHFAQSLICKDTACTLSLAGKMNWKPTIVTGVTAVSIDDSTGLSGNVWSNQLGWINLKPTGSGVSVNVSTGALTGYAWSTTCGWVNFAATGAGVNIVTETAESGSVGTGVAKFSGHAWCGGEGGGWIKFDCTVADSCVRTNWVKTADRFVASVPSSGGGGGGGGGGGSFVVSPSATTTIDNTFQQQKGPQSQRNGDYTALYRADIDDKGVVDLFDFNLLMVNWGKKEILDLTKTKSDRCKLANVADVNCDSIVNILDFNLIMVYWGKRIDGK